MAVKKSTFLVFDYNVVRLTKYKQANRLLKDPHIFKLIITMSLLL
jgi:hypothetical protein